MSDKKGSWNRRTAKADVSIMAAKTKSKAITGAVAVTPTTGHYFFAMQVVADTVVAAATASTGATVVDLTAYTSIPAGTVIYGQWSSITLTSGECIGYMAES